MLNGKVRSTWTDKFNRKFIAHKRLVKEVRASLMIGYIQQHYPEIRILNAIRHPIASSYSKIRLGWNMDLNTFLAQLRLVEEHLRSFLPQMEQAKTLWQRHIMAWSIENWMALKQLQDKPNSAIVFYENILLSPEDELNRIFKTIGITDTEAALKQIEKPSGMERGEFNTISPIERINSWQHKVSQKMQRQAFEILDLFGLTELYSSNSIPQLSQQQLLSQFND